MRIIFKRVFVGIITVLQLFNHLVKTHLHTLVLKMFSTCPALYCYTYTCNSAMGEL
jgi:hypothetical protein